MSKTRSLLALLAALAPGLGAAAAASLALESRPRLALTLGQERFDLWRACAVPERRLGLKPAREQDLARRADGTWPGMLFWYPGDRIMAFSMEDVAFDLDLVLLDGDGRLVHATPMRGAETRPYVGPEPARYALELGAGATAQTGLRVGDQALNPADLAQVQDLCSEDADRAANDY